MQLTPHIHVLELPFTVPLPSGPFERSVSVVLICTDTITLIDSGTAGAESRISDYLSSIGRKIEDIRLLVLSHSHPDHIGAAQAIVAATKCRVAAHAAERPWIEDIQLQAQQRPVPGFASLVGGSVPVTRIVADGDTIDVGAGMHLEVLHTPGHSHGSLSFWCPQEKVLITGDAIPVPGEMPIFDDLEQSLNSLRRLGELETSYLVSAWEPPLRGEGIPRRFEAGCDWLLQLKEAVQKSRSSSESIGPMGLCAEVVAALGLPPFCVNPLVARALMSCVTK